MNIRPLHFAPDDKRKTHSLDDHRSRHEKVREQLEQLLSSPDFATALPRLELPLRKAASALLSLLPHRNALVRWRAATGLGLLMARLAERDPEAARDRMRRLMWSLNEESGNCAWGAAEAMAEAMARSGPLAAEFAHVLVAYIIPEGPFLEYGPLLAGAVWGIGRVAEERPELVRHAGPYLQALLDSPDAGVRGLAAEALGILGEGEGRPGLEGLLSDANEYESFKGENLVTRTVSEAARESLDRIKGKR